MLGFLFSKKPTVHAQIQNIVRKANKRFFVFLKYKRSGISKERLKDAFTFGLRILVPSLSFTTNKESLLEKVQKRSLRLIYGYEKDYDSLLTESGLENLEWRREVLVNKFRRKTLKNPKYSSWFPLKPEVRQTRVSNKYLEEFALGSRLYNSPLFAMHRSLNGPNNDEPQIDLTNFYRFTV